MLYGISCLFLCENKKIGGQLFKKQIQKNNDVSRWLNLKRWSATARCGDTQTDHTQIGEKPIIKYNVNISLGA